jgi:Ca2+-binding EF-hand superfamily protein
MDFFAPSHEHRLLRPITAVLEEVSGFDKLLGKYEAWLASAHKALAGQLKKGEDDEKRAELLRHYESKTKSYVAARDTTINDLVAQVNAHFRTMPNDPAVGAVDLVRVPWASEASLRREGEMKDDNDEDEGEGERDREGEGGEGSSQLSHGPHPPFRSASEVALLVLHCQADYFEEGFIQNDYSGEDGGNGSDSEDSERRQVRNRNTNAVPPAPKPLGSNRSHGKGGVLAEASGGVHMVKLRSLLEGFCKLRLGPVPHVPHGGGAAAVPQEPDNHDGAPSSVDPSSSDKKKKADGDLPAVALVLGDALSEKFLSGVVRQLATGQKKRKDPEVSDGWLGGVAGAVVGLLQSFAHPTVDPYPSRGVVSPRDFRKALALSGVMVTADEVEDAAEPFLVASGGTQIDYERFIALLRRAWLAEWDSDGIDSSSDKGELADARKFLGLLRVHFEALSALQLNDTTTTNFDISQGGDVSGIAVDSGLLRSLRKLFKRADGGDGRLGPADLLECLRIATDQAVALAEKQFSHRFTAGDETSAAAVPRWMGDKENLPLAGGRARRLMRRLFEFLDDEGDGRVDGEEVLMLLDRGTVGDPAAERRGQLLEHTAKTFTSGRGSGMRGSMRFGGGGGDDYGGRGGDSSDDDDEDGDWLLSGIVNPDASNMSGSSFSRFGRLARVTNTAKDEEVALHPSIAKLARAVAERWPSDKDRAALKQYLQRHVRQNGTLGEQRFMRFLRKAGLLSDMSRRDVSGVLAILDPSKSQTVPVKLVLEHVIKVKREEWGDIVTILIV